MAETEGNHGNLMAVGNVLQDASRPMAERHRALFTLRNIGGQQAVDAISGCFTDVSCLLKHECAYCLGQMRDVRAVTKLTEVLEDKNQEAMVRHEAGEALGAIGSQESLSVLERYSSDPVVEVAETCQLAVERIRWLQTQGSKGTQQGPFLSVDPAPPAATEDVLTLREALLDESIPLFKRYRAMFALRNLNNQAAVEALGAGLSCSSALFRHEVAYVLGQMQHKAAVPFLRKNLKDIAESGMVRHECAEALGAIATPECMQLLKEYAVDGEVVVRESCEVALDMGEHEASGDFQYADTLVKLDS